MEAERASFCCGIKYMNYYYLQLREQLDENCSNLITKDIWVDDARHILISSEEQLKTVKSRLQW